MFLNATVNKTYKYYTVWGYNNKVELILGKFRGSLKFLCLQMPPLTLYFIQIIISKGLAFSEQLNKSMEFPSSHGSQ